ncbi:hypothetical protein PM082_010462 [Marasmius tenuissimus]|nr:hypothetical protein PM082_010462 [Marasmius tenuissimus]
MIVLPIFALCSFLPIALAQSQPQATCRVEFKWASNSDGHSPCDLASKVLSPCFGDNFSVSELVNGSWHYDAPVAERRPMSTNACTCSWAAYNLMSMCTACQDSAQDSILTWPQWKANCSSRYLRTSYFPSEYSIKDNASLPSYSKKDPALWNDQRFNLDQAKSLGLGPTSDSAKPTSVSTPSQSPSPSPSEPSTKSDAKNTIKIIGAVVGVILGGTALLLITSVYFILQRLKKKQGCADAENLPYASGGPSSASYRHFSTIIEPYSVVPRSPESAHRKSGSSFASTSEHTTCCSHPTAAMLIPHSPHHGGLPAIPEAASAPESRSDPPAYSELIMSGVITVTPPRPGKAPIRGAISGNHCRHGRC